MKGKIILWFGEGFWGFGGGIKGGGEGGRIRIGEGIKRGGWCYDAATLGPLG